MLPGSWLNMVMDQTARIPSRRWPGGAPKKREGTYRDDDDQWETKKALAQLGLQPWRHGGRGLDEVPLYGQESNYSSWNLAHMNPAIQGIKGQISYYCPIAGATDETRLLDAAIAKNLERLGFTDE